MKPYKHPCLSRSYTYHVMSCYVMLQIFDWFAMHNFLGSEIICLHLLNSKGFINIALPLQVYLGVVTILIKVILKFYVQY